MLGWRCDSLGRPPARGRVVDWRPILHGTLFGGIVMQTQLMQPLDSSVPWLERFTADSDTPERTPLKSAPFTIGRIDTADLQINSTRVSREHAVIERAGSDYRIRDLGSTNGTFVNGERIEDVALEDGDVLVIADCEFTFVRNAAPAVRNMATQQMPGGTDRPRSGAKKANHIGAIRRLQELLLCRGLLPQLRPIVDIEHGSIFAYRGEPIEACLAGADLDIFAKSQIATRGALARAQELYRLLTAEAFINLGQEAQLVVQINADEMDGRGELRSHVLRLQHVAGKARLVVGLPANSVADDPRARTLAEGLKADGVRLAYVSFLGGKAQLQPLAEIAPDLLILAPNAASELNSPRQCRQLSSLVEGCADLGCQPIVTGLKKREDEEACHKLGIRLVATDRWSRPASTSSGGKRRDADAAPVHCLA